MADHLILCGVIAVVVFGGLGILAKKHDDRYIEPVETQARRDPRYRGLRYTPEMWRGMARGVKLVILKRVRKVKG